MSIRTRKLLIISDMFPHETNPVAGIFVRHQAEALARHYQVKVLATWFPSEPEVRVSQTPEYELVYVRYPQSRLLFPLTVLGYRKWVLPRLKTILESWKPDIIHVHDCRHIPELYCLAETLKFQHAAKYLSVHNIKTLPERAEYAYLRYIYKKTLAAAYEPWDRVFFVNEALRSRMMDLVPPSKSLYLGNAIIPALPCKDRFIDALAADLDHENFNILAVGNLKRGKGLDLLIRSVAEIRYQGNKIALRIIGDGEEKDRLLDLALRLGIERQVTLYPAQPNQVIRQVYKLFDLFALPSWSETFGIVYLEAMDAGIPVIGVEGQGIDGVVEDGVNGLLCLPKDQASLSDKIRWVMDNREAASELALKGQQLVRERYMMDSLVARLMDVYESR